MPKLWPKPRHTQMLPACTNVPIRLEHATRCCNSGNGWNVMRCNFNRDEGHGEIMKLQTHQASEARDIASGPKERIHYRIVKRYWVATSADTSRKMRGQVISWRTWVARLPTLRAWNATLWNATNWANQFVAGKDLTPDLKIMRPTRCQLHYCCLAEKQLLAHVSAARLQLPSQT